MIGGVIGEHQWRQKRFPIQSGAVNERRQVSGDSFVDNFCLSVSLGVSGGCCDMKQIEFGPEILTHMCYKFFALVRDKLGRDAISAYPISEDGVCNTFSFFVGDGYQFDIFSKCIRDDQYVFLSVSRCF